jgi:hypothetical protein
MRRTRARQHTRTNADISVTLSTHLCRCLLPLQTTIAAEPTITPLLLSAWSANSTKPMISDAVTDLFERLLALSTASCISVQVRVLLVIESIFAASTASVAVSGTLGAALDLLKFVLLAVEQHTRALKGPDAVVTSPSANEKTAAPEYLHPLLFSTLLPRTLTLLLHTDDHSLVEVGTTVLTAFLRIDSAQVAVTLIPVVLPGAPSGSAPVSMTGLQLLCTIIAQFLNPALDDKIAHNVGNLIVQVVFSLGTAIGEQNVKELIKAGTRTHTRARPPALLCPRRFT